MTLMSFCRLLLAMSRLFVYWFGSMFIYGNFITFRVDFSFCDIFQLAVVIQFEITDIREEGQRRIMKGSVILFTQKFYAKKKYNK